MTTDPRDAEIARLTAELSDMRNGWEKSVRAHAEVLAERDAALVQVARLQHLIREASDPDFIWGAMDNVNDMDADLDEFAKAASRAIRAAVPTPAAAQAALDASVNAARAEGRVMGLREAVDVADHFRDSCGECNWPEDAVLVGVNVADDIARAILAKIKEAE